MIYFVLYLVLEVIISVNLASYITGADAFIEIIASAVVGIVILLNYRHALTENIRALQMRQMNTEEFMQLNLLGLMGAVLLILPGVLSDIIGVLIVLSLTIKLLVNRFSRKYTESNQPNQSKKDDYVIDAEIIDDTAALR